MAIKKRADKAGGPSTNTRMIRDNTEKKPGHSTKGSPDLIEPTPESLIHELQEHQVKLEIQAEELRKTLFALEESHDKYIELYSGGGVIVLGKERVSLVREMDPNYLNQ